MELNEEQQIKKIKSINTALAVADFAMEQEGDQISFFYTLKDGTKVPATISSLGEQPATSLEEKFSKPKKTKPYGSTMKVGELEDYKIISLEHEGISVSLRNDNIWWFVEYYEWKENGMEKSIGLSPFEPHTDYVGNPRKKTEPSITLFSGIPKGDDGYTDPIVRIGLYRGGETTISANGVEETIDSELRIDNPTLTFKQRVATIENFTDNQAARSVLEKMGLVVGRNVTAAVDTITSRRGLIKSTTSLLEDLQNGNTDLDYKTYFADDENKDTINVIMPDITGESALNPSTSKLKRQRIPKTKEVIITDGRMKVTLIFKQFPNQAEALHGYYYEDEYTELTAELLRDVENNPYVTLKIKGKDGERIDYITSGYTASEEKLGDLKKGTLDELQDAFLSYYSEALRPTKEKEDTTLEVPIKIFTQ